MSINVPLDAVELDALLHMARAECRHPREQMRFLLRQEAQRRGLLVGNVGSPAPYELSSNQNDEEGAKNDNA